MHCVYCNFDTIKIVFSCYKATFPIFKNRSYFSVTSIVLIDVSVRGCNAIQEVFHVYLNKFENAAAHLFLVIFGNN